MGPSATAPPLPGPRSPWVRAPFPDRLSPGLGSGPRRRGRSIWPRSDARPPSPQVTPHSKTPPRADPGSRLKGPEAPPSFLNLKGPPPPPTQTEKNEEHLPAPSTPAPDVQVQPHLLSHHSGVSRGHELPDLDLPGTRAKPLRIGRNPRPLGLVSATTGRADPHREQGRGWTSTARESLRHVPVAATSHRPFRDPPSRPTQAPPRPSPRRRRPTTPQRRGPSPPKRGVERGGGCRTRPRARRGGRPRPAPLLNCETSSNPRDCV